MVTVLARIAINALASFEHADIVTAELGADNARGVAAAQATQAPKGGPPGAARSGAALVPPTQGPPAPPGGPPVPPV